jgi:hypothetical protein
VTSSRLNAVTKTRSMSVSIVHPGLVSRPTSRHTDFGRLIWTNVAFDADVVSWDLSALPDRGRIRHHIKEASGYGIDEWSLSLTIQLNDAEFEGALKQSQIRKGQRGGSASDHPQGFLRIDYSGKKTLHDAGRADAVTGLDRDGLFAANQKDYKQGSRSMDFFAQLEKTLPDYADAMLLTTVSGHVYV